MNNIQLLEQKGINLKGKISGQIKTLCPECSETRKNKRDLCLSVNIDDGVYSCHNCDFKGRVFQKQAREYIKPIPRPENVGAKSLKFFENERKISNNTLLRFKVTEATEPIGSITSPVALICFNYYRDGELVNVKFRGPLKSFRMAPGAELIFYNLDAIKEETECVIVEGEIDCLTLHECGIFNSVSVPNGASKGSMKLEYLDNCWEYFAGKTKIVLMVDGDAAGFELREELARRLGKERCFKVQYPEGCKDANEILVKYGREAVAETVNSATQWPIEGICEMEDMVEDVYHYYENGYPAGMKSGIPCLDELVSFMPGQYTTITGIPGSGKSEFCDWLMVLLAEKHLWPWAVCSFENQPSSIHVTKLIEKFINKSFAFRRDPNHRINQAEMDFGVEMVRRYFHFINLAQVDLTLTGLLQKAKELVERKGIKGMVIDPWNYIEHKVPQGHTETQYISECLTEIKTFALQNGIHIFLIAHPTKIQKDLTGHYNVPTLYNISGSAHFFNKTDNGITVYRDFAKGLVTVYVQKIRFSWLGKLGDCSFNYNTDTRQYIPIEDTREVHTSKLIPLKNFTEPEKQELPF